MQGALLSRLVWRAHDIGMFLSVVAMCVFFISYYFVVHTLCEVPLLEAIALSSYIVFLAGAIFWIPSFIVALFFARHGKYKKLIVDAILFSVVAITIYLRV